MFHNAPLPESIQEQLGVNNWVIGYALLVDRDGLVRWRAQGKPTETEIKSMLKCCNSLLKEST